MAGDLSRSEARSMPEDRPMPRVPAGPRPSARRPAVRARQHDVPQAAVRSSGSSSCARPEAPPVQLHPVAWVRALRAGREVQDVHQDPRTQVPEAERAKARAVAALQQLFFEALRHGEDANGAAASALRRLLEPGSAAEGPKACHDPIYARKGRGSEGPMQGCRHPVAVET
ncbi:unnamed protein product [Effrenium voratum]|nr:unnamed protein product [Effrenium voratum]